jgi:hypothetical protein
LPATPSNLIIIQNISSALISAQTFTLTINGIVNYNKAVTTSQFKLSLYYTNDISQLVANASANGITLVPKALLSSSIDTKLSNYVVVSTGVTYNITFTASDAVQSNGYIIITLPQ